MAMVQPRRVAARTKGSAGGIFAHGAALHGQRLLILRGDASIEAGADCFAVFFPWPKTFPDFLMSDPCFMGIS
jgi:hypothetical protein